jgi:hypothetical protein
MPRENKAVHRLIAAAMITQCEHDQEAYRDVTTPNSDSNHLSVDEHIRVGRAPQRIESGTKHPRLGKTWNARLDFGPDAIDRRVRWFWPDRPPQEFHAWFVGAGAAWGRPARAKHLSTSTFAIRTKIPLASRRVAAATSRSRGCLPLNLPAAHRQSTLGQVGIAHAGWPAARRKAAPDAKLLDPCRLRLRACDFERAGLWRCSFRNDCARLKESSLRCEVPGRPLRCRLRTGRRKPNGALCSL